MKTWRMAVIDEDELVMKGNWSGKRDLNPRPSPWQGDALPLSYSRSLKRIESLDSSAALKWCQGKGTFLILSYDLPKVFS